MGGSELEAKCIESLRSSTEGDVFPQSSQNARVSYDASLVG